MLEILPAVRKVIFVWFMAATDPDTATLWMTEPLVMAWVRSSVFAAGAFARDMKTARPARSPTRATATIRPGQVVKMPLSTLIDRSPLADQLSYVAPCDDVACARRAVTTAPSA